MSGRVGASSLAFFTIPSTETIKILGDSGFPIWEMILEGHHRKKDYSEIKKQLAFYGMDVSIHAPFADLNIASLNENIRQESIRQVKESIRVADFLDARVVTFHSGRYSPYSLWFKEEALKVNRKSMGEIVDYAKRLEVPLGLENTPEFFGAINCGIQEMESILDSFGDMQLGMTLDVGHAHTCGDPGMFAEKLGPYLVNMHLHDNAGGNDDHLAVGDGKIDFKSFFRKLKGYKGDFIIEVHSQEDVWRSMERLGKLIP